jgi:hypothetical protein
VQANIRASACFLVACPFLDSIGYQVNAHFSLAKKTIVKNQPECQQFSAPNTGNFKFISKFKFPARQYRLAQLSPIDSSS